MSDSNYTDVLLEDMNSKFDAILEAVSPIGRMLQNIADTKDDMAELKADVKIIKAAVTDLSVQVKDHDSRIATLESA